MNQQQESVSMLQTLRELLESSAHRKMQTPKDFEFLSDTIYKQTHQLVNSSTLKRLFGYIGSEVTPRESTLDILCHFVGYTDWHTFSTQNNSGKGNESMPLVSEHLHTDSLKIGDQLRVLWQPDRDILIRYEGQNVFTVIEANNSKLQAGNTFRNNVFIQNEPLFLTEVTGLLEKPVDYVCGKHHGVKYFLL